MKEKKTKDRRILRSQQMIEEAFLRVLKRKEYADITVIDITEEADINRSTFYAHYVDKDDLLEKITREKLELLKNLRISRQTDEEYAPAFHEPDIYFTELFDHLAENEHFYRVMLSRSTPANLPGKIQEMIKESFYQRAARLQRDQKLEVPLDILLDFIASSVQGIIIKWLDNDRIYSPHYMALQLTRLSMLGIYKAMGLKERPTG